MRQDLVDQGHLRALLGPARTTTAAAAAAEAGAGSNQRGRGRGRGRERCLGYSLRVTGHSLGGSTGALLTYMLRRDYPTARCVAISPLGGLLNSPHAEECGDFVLSAALGEDVVPRLSVVAMERMRDEILELIARTKVREGVGERRGGGVGERATRPRVGALLAVCLVCDREGVLGSPKVFLQYSVGKLYTRKRRKKEKM